MATSAENETGSVPSQVLQFLLIVQGRQLRLPLPIRTFVGYLFTSLENEKTNEMIKYFFYLKAEHIS